MLLYLCKKIMIRIFELNTLDVTNHVQQRLPLQNIVTGAWYELNDFQLNNYYGTIIYTNYLK